MHKHQNRIAEAKLPDDIAKAWAKWFEEVDRPNALILDVREPAEYQQAHLLNAVNVSLSQLEQEIQEIVPDKSTPIVCYCAGGNRGALAADTLNKMGYTNAVSIEGGLKAWESSGKATIDTTEANS